MLKSLLRDNGSIEDYSCTTCGRPLLNKQSVCPVCQKNPPVSSLDTKEDVPYSAGANPPRGVVAFQNKSMEAKSLWFALETIGLSGLVFSLLILFSQRNLFEGCLLLQASMLTITAGYFVKR